MRVLVSDRIADEAIELLKEHADVDVHEYSHDELLSCIKDYDALIVRSRTKVTRDVIEQGEKLKVIGRAGVGVDNIDVTEATKHGIYVVNAPLGSTYSVAELALGHMLSLARRLPDANTSMKAGLWEKKKLKGVELYGKTLGIIGFGRIGQEVGRRAKAFSMDILVYDPYLNERAVREIGVRPVELKELLEKSDFITIHALLTEETRHMISEDELRSMKPSAYLVNCARGGIVDEDALYRALAEGWIAGAALDVFENEPPKDSKLLTLSNAYFTPHIGASTADAQRRAGMTTAEQVIKVLNGEKPDFLVNPEVIA